MLPREYLISHHTHIRSTLQQSPINLETSSQKTLIIILSFGIAPANRGGHYTPEWTKIPRALTLSLFSYENLHETSVKRGNVIQSSHNGE